MMNGMRGGSARVRAGGRGCRRLGIFYIFGRRGRVWAGMTPVRCQFWRSGRAKAPTERPINRIFRPESSENRGGIAGIRIYLA